MLFLVSEIESGEPEHVGGTSKKTWFDVWIKPRWGYWLCIALSCFGLIQIACYLFALAGIGFGIGPQVGQLIKDARGQLITAGATMIGAIFPIVGFALSHVQKEILQAAQLDEQRAQADSLIKSQEKRARDELRYTRASDEFNSLKEQYLQATAALSSSDLRARCHAAQHLAEIACLPDPRKAFLNKVDPNDEDHFSAYKESVKNLDWLPFFDMTISKLCTALVHTESVFEDLSLEQAFKTMIDFAAERGSPFVPPSVRLQVAQQITSFLKTATNELLMLFMIAIVTDEGRKSAILNSLLGPKDEEDWRKIKDLMGLNLHRTVVDLEYHHRLRQNDEWLIKLERKIEQQRVATNIFFYCFDRKFPVLIQVNDALKTSPSDQHVGGQYYRIEYANSVSIELISNEENMLSGQEIFFIGSAVYNSEVINVDFRKSIFLNCKFKNSEFVKCEFSESIWLRTRFINSKWELCWFEDVHLLRSSIVGSKFASSCISLFVLDSEWKDAELIRCILQGGKLNGGAFVASSVLHRSLVLEARSLEHCCFYKIHIDGANFNAKVMKNVVFICCSADEAIIESEVFEQVNLYGSFLGPNSILSWKGLLVKELDLAEYDVAADRLFNRLSSNYEVSEFIKES